MFLREADAKEFKLATGEQLAAPTTLVDFYAPEGTLTLDPDLDSTAFDTYEEHLGLIEVLRKRAKKQSDQLIQEYVQMSGTLSNLAVTFSQLDDLQGSIPAFEPLGTIYGEVSDMVARWSQNTKEQIDVI